MSVDEASRLIRPCIGLTERQATANMNYYEHIKRNLLKNNPNMSITAAEKKAREAAIKYGEKQHRYRAQTIAQTELVSANNQAYLATIKDAVSKNIIGYGKLVWSCTNDENSCEECRALDGVSVEIGQDFPVKGTEYFKGQHQAPPAHTNCGCGVYYEEMDVKYYSTNENAERDYSDVIPNNNFTFDDKGSIIELETDNKGNAYVDRDIELPENIKAYDKKLKNKGDYITGAANEFTESDIQLLTAKAITEFAVISIGAKSILLKGDEISTEIPKNILNEIIENNGTLDFHTHPYEGDILASLADMEVIGMLEEKTGQERSKIVSIDGKYSVFNKYGVIETGVIERKIDNNYKKTINLLFGKGD